MILNEYFNERSFERLPMLRDFFPTAADYYPTCRDVFPSVRDFYGYDVRKSRQL